MLTLKLFWFTAAILNSPVNVGFSEPPLVLLVTGLCTNTLSFKCISSSFLLLISLSYCNFCFLKPFLCFLLHLHELFLYGFQASLDLRSLFFKNFSEPFRQGSTFGINPQGLLLHISIKSVPLYLLNCCLVFSRIVIFHHKWGKV